MPSDEQRSENLSSVELSLNAKGKLQFSVKVYEEDPDQAKAAAVRIVEDLKKQLAGQLADEPPAKKGGDHV